jgi:hypothetical protein
MKWLTATRAMAVLVALVLIVGAANLVATRLYVDGYKTTQARQQAEQRAAGIIVEQKLCATLDAIAALKPPPGSAAANPSRAFEQNLHTVLDKLGPDLGCRR